MAKIKLNTSILIDIIPEVVNIENLPRKKKKLLKKKLSIKVLKILRDAVRNSL